MYLLAEIASIILLSAGINLGIFKQILSLKRSKYLKILYFFISLAVLPLAIVLTSASMVNAVLGTNIAINLSAISILLDWYKTLNQAVLNPAATSAQKTDDPFSEVQTPRLCRLALNIQYNEWSASTEFSQYVAEAKRRQLSLDECRNALGMQALREEAIQTEKDRLAQLTEADICQKALNGPRDGWDFSEVYRLAADEAIRRRYTVNDCRATLGVVQNDEPAIPQTSETVEEPLKFPVARISNSKASFANFRDRPGSRSNIVAKLPNGTPVIIIGSSPSPATGHIYCRLQTTGGIQGYVDHELVDRPCQLTFEQERYVVEIDRNRDEEALRIFTGIAGAVIGLARKN